jgi:hypothetical protein
MLQSNPETPPAHESKSRRRESEDGSLQPTIATAPDPNPGISESIVSLGRREQAGQLPLAGRLAGNGTGIVQRRGATGSEP